MGIRIAWTDSNTAEDGYNVYRHTASMAGLTDTQLATYLLAALPADAIEYKDGTAVDGTTYFYLVATRSGSVLVRGTEVEVTAADTSGGGGADFSTAAIGDEIGGGVYAGTITYSDTRQFHIIFAKQAGESAEGPKWGNYGTTTGATDPDDGLANQNLILTSFDNGDSEPFYHCRDYVDGDGNADYYLPASNELALEANIRGHAEMSTDTGAYRWSSTEDSVNGALNRRFSDGYEFATSKLDTGRRVRPVRRVAV